MSQPVIRAVERVPSGSGYPDEASPQPSEADPFTFAAAPASTLDHSDPGSLYDSRFSSTAYSTAYSNPLPAVPTYQTRAGSLGQRVAHVFRNPGEIVTAARQTAQRVGNALFNARAAIGGTWRAGPNATHDQEVQSINETADRMRAAAIARATEEKTNRDALVATAQAAWGRVTGAGAAVQRNVVDTLSGANETWTDFHTEARAHARDHAGNILGALATRAQQGAARQHSRRDALRSPKTPIVP